MREISLSLVVEFVGVMCMHCDDATIQLTQSFVSRFCCSLIITIRVVKGDKEFLSGVEGGAE